jgi:SAM-dependent methyltransferase
MEVIKFKDKVYPKFQSEGFAAKFAFPYAQQVCKGVGFDVGCGSEEWALPGAIAIDPKLKDTGDAMNLPLTNVDYIFSSHCLEHLDNWVDVLDYWSKVIVPGGVLFLYLPDFSQEYWRPWNNRKHKNIFTPEFIEAYMKEKYTNIFKSGVDLNSSFMIYGERK